MIWSTSEIILLLIGSLLGAFLSWFILFRNDDTFSKNLSFHDFFIFFHEALKPNSPGNNEIPRNEMVEEHNNINQNENMAGEEIHVDRNDDQRIQNVQEVNENIQENHESVIMTKKMLMKAEKKRLKMKRKMDMEAWIQMKQERDLIRQERHLERFGRDTDESDDSDDNNSISEHNNTKIKDDYRRYIDMYPQILSHMKHSRRCDISDMIKSFGISSEMILIDIIQCLERSGSIQGLFIDNNKTYIRLERKELEDIASKLKTLKIFSIDDVTTVFNEYLSNASIQ